MNTSSENIVCVHRVTKKKVFKQLTLAVACSTRRRPASGEVKIRHSTAATAVMCVDVYDWLYFI